MFVEEIERARRISDLHAVANATGVHFSGVPRKNTADKQPPRTLKGWKAIAEFLGIPVATAQRWAKDGMPVRREGRSKVAEEGEIRAWLGRESHMPAPAQVLTGKADLSGALRESIAAARNKRKK